MSKKTKKNRKILVISGKQYSGKDTVANILMEIIPGFKLAPLAGAIKEEFGEQKGIKVKEIEMNKPIYRADLIELGNKRRSEDADYWIKKVIDLDEDIIVSDARLKYEINTFDKYGAVKIRVEADRDSRSTRGKLVKEDDKTETDLDDYKKWDYIIENNGSYEELKEKVEKLTQNLIKDLSLQTA